jgi:hypothetical protein
MPARSSGKLRSSRSVNFTVTGSVVLTLVMVALTPVLGDSAPLGPNTHT